MKKICHSRVASEINRVGPGHNVRHSLKHYNILGDFDFKEPGNPDKKYGKTPKFAFGAKNVIKDINIDFPGPAEYETD